MKKQRYKGVRANANSIDIDFVFMGRRRETLALAPTAANQAYANELRRTIRGAVALGKFGLAEYAQYFPKSRWLARQTTSGPTGTVGAALDSWYERARATLKPSTARCYRNAINEIKSTAVGALPLNQLTTAALRDLIADWQHQQITVKTIKNKLLPLRGMLDDAVERETIPSNPLARIRKIKRGEWEKMRRSTDEDDVDPFDLQEVAAILVQPMSPQIQNFIEVGIWSGLRTGEMFALAWEDIDWIKKQIYVRRSRTDGLLGLPKTESSVRKVDMLPPVEAALVRQKQHTLMRDAVDCGPFGKLHLVFYNPYQNDVWQNDQQFRKGFWAKLLRKAGVRYRYPYHMRHTYASTLITVGEPIEYVAKQLGHKDTTMVRTIYAKWLKQVAEEAGRSGGSKIAKLWTNNEGKTYAQR